MRTGLLLPLSVLALSTHEHLLADYERSKTRCTHGVGGVIIKLHDHSLAPESVVAALQARRRSTDMFRHTFSARHTIRGFSALLSEDTLNEVLRDAETHGVQAVHADCIISLRNRFVSEEATTHLSSRSQTVLLGKASEDVSFVEGKQTASPNWGLDRADQLSGEDGIYTFGNATGKGTVLYQIDTGVQFSHSEFAELGLDGQPTGRSRIINGLSMGCRDPVAQSLPCANLWAYGANVTDDVLSRRNVIPAEEEGQAASMTPEGEGCDAHGTHTASTAAGNEYGVAKEASIVVIQGLSCIATALDSVVVKALEWVVDDARARTPYMPAVVLMSLGGERDTLLNEAVKRTTEHHVNVVVAAGNEATDACTETPSDVQAAATIAATDAYDKMASFSNYGQCVDLLAPGCGITAAYARLGSTTSTQMLSGTSMAAPFVAGAMLQALQLLPQMRSNETKALISCVASTGKLTLTTTATATADTPNKLVRIGDVFSSVTNLRSAVAGGGADCESLVESLARTRPVNGTLYASPDVNYETVILPESSIPERPAGDLPAESTPYMAMRRRTGVKEALQPHPL